VLVRIDEIFFVPVRSQNFRADLGETDSSVRVIPEVVREQDGNFAVCFEFTKMVGC
jgi:hypothetical protein